MTRYGTRATTPRCRFRNVRFAPESGQRATRRACLLSAKSGLVRRSKTALFGHLVGAQEDRRRDGEFERLRGPEVHYQLA